MHKLSVNKCMCCSQLYSMRSVDHVAGSATLVQDVSVHSLDRDQSHVCTFAPSLQSRSLYGRHVSTSFLDPVFGAMMNQACRPTLKSFLLAFVWAAEFLNSCLRGLIVLVACIWCRWLFVMSLTHFLDLGWWVGA